MKVDTNDFVGGWRRIISVGFFELRWRMLRESRMCSGKVHHGELNNDCRAKSIAGLTHRVLARNSWNIDLFGGAVVGNADSNHFVRSFVKEALFKEIGDITRWLQLRSQS